jgi:hypothetical protein
MAHTGNDDTTAEIGGGEDWDGAGARESSNEKTAHYNLDHNIKRAIARTFFYWTTIDEDTKLKDAVAQ